MADWDCISNEEFRALQTATVALTPDEVQALWERPMCRPNVTIHCANLTEDAVRAIAQCERDLKLGMDVPPVCVTRTHPAILSALERSCPDAQTRLNIARSEAGIRADMLSTGAFWALLAASAAMGVAVALMLPKQK